ncbi:MAG: hypothetical protein ACREDF_04230, partial [Thermoplasmata archaeon]
FAGLLGRSGPLTGPEMQAFTDFILQVTYPPNPIRALDNSLTADQQAGRNFFLNSTPSDVFQSCDGCHALDPAAGFFGGDGFMSFENETQFLKIPHLRNMYQKVGMFGMAQVAFFNGGDNGSKGDQVRGFGFLHDGGLDTLFRFHNATVFNRCNPGGIPVGCGFNAGGFENGAPGDPARKQVEAFMMTFDSNMAPIVGQQITLSNTNAPTVGPRIGLLIARAAANECDLVVKGTLNGLERGWLRTPGGLFESDREGETPLADAALRAQAADPSGGQERTYTCVPPGSGLRVGIDRDEDGHFDRDELDAGSDPADPSSVPVPDVDADGVANTSDNCVVSANGLQIDADADSHGNACDCDHDQNEICGFPDFDIFLQCFGLATGAGVGPPDDSDCEESDQDANGLTGFGDFNLFLVGFGAPPGPSCCL